VRYKKHLIILVILMGLIFSLSFYFKLFSIQKIRFSITGLFSQSITETDISSALKKLIGGEKQVILKIAGENKCYWITTTRKGKNYVLELSEYISKTGQCIGLPSSESEIPLNSGIDIIGDTDCVCSGREYLLEWKEIGLKITRM
jgi:hypothetical protein